MLQRGFPEQEAHCRVGLLVVVGRGERGVVVWFLRTRRGDLVVGGRTC